MYVYPRASYNTGHSIIIGSREQVSTGVKIRYLNK